MLRGDEIRTALVQYLKSVSDITDLVSSDEIREAYWKGTGFSYPNIRVRMTSIIPASKDCNYVTFTSSIMVYTEKASSLEAEQITGIIYNVLHERSFSTNGIAFSIITTNAISAVPAFENVWRAECLLRGTAS